MIGSGIKLFEIKGLFNQFNIALPLDNNVNIFLGENGMGKTTILNCLYFVLYGNYERLNNILFDENIHNILR
jgi:DNA repair exonuclease SbcCD ATPase subunit